MELRYHSRRHRSLMRESEQALEDAVESPDARASRIARHVLTDSKVHSLWEARHAQLVLPVAEHNSRTPQIVELRRMEVALVHRRALVDYIGRYKLTGAKRDKLLSRFYGAKASLDAVLAEHRQYMLAVSSRVSADHLIDIMQDPFSRRFLEVYERAYNKYFELYCYVACTEDALMAEAVRPDMLRARERAKRIRERLVTAKPDNRRLYSFDRQADLARSGRYPIVNYMLA